MSELLSPAPTPGLTSALCVHCNPDLPAGPLPRPRGRAARHRAGTITYDQHKTICALLFDLSPVLKPQIISDYVTGVLGIPFGTGDSLWALSRHQAGDVLEALEARRLPSRKHAREYNAKHQPGATRRPTQGEHRA